MSFDGITIWHRKQQAKQKRMTEKVRLILASHEFKYRMEPHGAKYTVHTEQPSYTSLQGVTDYYPEHQVCDRVELPDGVEIRRLDHCGVSVTFDHQTVFEYGDVSKVGFRPKYQITSYAPDPAWLGVFDRFVDLVKREAVEYARDQKKRTAEAKRRERQRKADERKNRWKL